MRTDHTMLTLERTLAHPIDRVWRAVSEPGELAAWFVAAVSWTPPVGEPIEAYGRHAGPGIGSLPTSRSTSSSPRRRTCLPAAGTATCCASSCTRTATAACS